MHTMGKSKNLKLGKRVALAKLRYIHGEVTHMSTAVLMPKTVHMPRKDLRKP